MKVQGHMMEPVERFVALCAIRLCLGCVRFWNPDLDFQNLNPDFPIERTLNIAFHLSRDMVNKTPDWYALLPCVNFSNVALMFKMAFYLGRVVQRRVKITRG